MSVLVFQFQIPLSKEEEGFCFKFFKCKFETQVWIGGFQDGSVIEITQSDGLTIDNNTTNHAALCYTGRKTAAFPSLLVKRQEPQPLIPAV